MAKEKDNSGYETFDSLDGPHHKNQGGKSGANLEGSKSIQGAPDPTPVTIQKGGK